MESECLITIAIWTITHLENDSPFRAKAVKYNSWQFVRSVSDAVEIDTFQSVHKNGAIMVQLFNWNVYTSQ